jgi:hypothetical protein
MASPFTGEWQRRVPVPGSATQVRLRPLYNVWAAPTGQVRLPTGPDETLAEQLRPTGTVDVGDEFGTERGTTRMTWTWTSDKATVAQVLWSDGPVYQAVVLQGLVWQHDRWWLARGVLQRVKFSPLPTRTGLITNVWAFLPPGGNFTMRWMRRAARDTDADVYGGWGRLDEARGRAHHAAVR